MAKQEAALVSFSGGELSYKMYGRFELPITRNGCRRLENFIAELQGPAKFRTGLRYVYHTRLNQIANLIKFEFNDEQAYQLEFTNKKLRFYKDEALITESTKTVTAITQAATGVVTTSGAHGYATGDEVYISGVLGMTEINDQFYRVTVLSPTTFELRDIDGLSVNTTSFTAYSSAGTSARVYEIDTPYTEALNLFILKPTQNADTMYIDHPYYEPRKLTRTGHTSWTLSRYTRTNDPFLTKKVITAVTQASPGVVTSNAHGYANDDIVIIEEVVGMTQLNSQPYLVKNVAANTFELYNLDGTAHNTTGYTLYASAGFASDQGLLPAAITFYESRLWHGGAFSTPNKFVGSRGPSNVGVPRYEDYTSGTDDDHAVEYTIADEEVNKIFWLKGTDRLLFAGTFGSEVKITGETDDKPITPTSVNVRAVNKLGVADIVPINKENSVIYVQRGKRTVRSFEFDALSDAFVSIDRNLVSDHITEGNIKQMAWQSGRPDILWMVKEDGELLGVTYKFREDVSGWHRHRTYGGEDKFLSISTMPRNTGFEQIWVVVERVIDGKLRRNVEYFSDEAVIPNPQDYFTGAKNKAADLVRFGRAMAEAQKGYLHLDSALTYDGSALGLSQNISVTPGAISGTSVIFTASGAFFKPENVGREIRKKAIKGVGHGRAKITGYTSPTQVTCKMLEDFDSASIMTPGNWYITASTFGNLGHLEGRFVDIVVDGGIHPSKTVVEAGIDLEYEASVMHVGLGYDGFLQPMALEIAGVTGPSQTKPRNIYKLGIKLFNSLGCEFGTDIYAPEEVVFTEMPLQVGNPPPLYTGVKKASYSDSWEDDKIIYIRQTNPLPCIVQLIAIYGEGDND